MKEISVSDLNARRDAGEEVQLIDVRQPDEYAFAHIEGSVLIPMAEIFSRLSELDPKREAVIMCRSGGRSAQVIAALERSGYTGDLSNLSGGILAWSSEVDPSIPRY